ncbi:MAG: hypothetical protein IOD15_11000 [Phycisphaerales bacterium]|nr:hypothetical protein [Phycisphaerales bacterium]
MTTPTSNPPNPPTTSTPTAPATAPAPPAAEPAAVPTEEDHTLCPACGNLSRRIGQSLTQAGLVRYRRCRRCPTVFKTIGVWLRGDGQQGLRASERRI